MTIIITKTTQKVLNCAKPESFPICLVWPGLGLIVFCIRNSTVEVYNWEPKKPALRKNLPEPSCSKLATEPNHPHKLGHVPLTAGGPACGGYDVVTREEGKKPQN